MELISLSASTRMPGKKQSRAVRREGDVPCVLYGHHVDPVAFRIEEKSLHSLIYTDESHLVKVTLGEDAWDCILKDIAYHPVTDRPMHADFQVLEAGEKVTMTIPVRYIGTPIGQMRGGRTNLVVNELTVSCLPKHIPSQIDVNVTDIDIGDAVHVANLDLKDLEFHAPDDQILITVLRPRTVEEPEAAEDELEEAAEGDLDEAQDES